MVAPCAHHSSPPPLRQGLLDGIAVLSAQQERLQRRLPTLDSAIAGLAAALPAAWEVAAAGGGGGGEGGGGLYCRLRPLGRLSSGPGAVSSGGTVDEAGLLSVEVALHNSGALALPAGWSLAVTHGSVGGDGSSSDSSTCADLLSVAAPVGYLPPGAAWRQQCWMPLPPPGAPAQLRVLLCHHGGSCSRSSGSSAVLLLHSMRLDALHLLQLGSDGDGGSGSGNLVGGGGDSGWVQAKLLLQMQRSCWPPQQPNAGSQLRQTLELGLCSRRQLPPASPQPWGAGVGASAPAALALLGAHPPPPAAAAPGAQQGEAASAACDGRVAISARLLPVPPSSGLAASQLLLQLGVGGGDAATALDAHRCLCQRAALLAAAGVGRVGGVSGAPIGAASAAVGDAALEHALLQLRQLRAAAEQLRGGASGIAAGAAAAADRQRRGRDAQVRVVRLALAAREALAGVPLLV